MLRKYEAMFLLKPDLAPERRNEIFSQISDSLIKNDSQVIKQDIWEEKRKLAYQIKKYKEALYYLVQFQATTQLIEKLRHLYGLNEDILRTLIVKID